MEGEYSPFARLDNLTTRPTNNASAAVVVGGGGASSYQSPSSNSGISSTGGGSHKEDFTEFWKDLKKWKEQIVSSPCTALVQDPQLQPRSWSNPNPPIMFLVTSVQNGFNVRRRYSDFEYLRQILLTRYIGVLIPPLPEKKMVGNKEGSFLKNRMRGLGFFIERILQNPFLRMDPTTVAFLSMNDPALWNEHKKAHPVSVSSDSNTNASSTNTTNATSTSTAAGVTTAALASATSNTLASASSFFSSIASSTGAAFSGVTSSAAPAGGSTGTSVVGSPIATSASDDLFTPSYPVNFNIDRFAQDSESRWRAAVVTYELPEDFEKLIADVKVQLDSLESVMRALVQSSLRAFTAAQGYASILREFTASYDQVIKVEIQSATAAANSKGESKLSSPSGKELVDVLQKMGNTFKSWIVTVDSEQTILEQLLHEILLYELSCIREMKRLLSQRDAMIAARDKVLRLQRLAEVEKDGYEKTGKQDRVQKVQLKISEYVNNIKHQDFIISMMSKGLFLDTLDTFSQQKIAMFKDLIGKLAAAKVLQAQQQQNVWMSSLESFGLKFDPNATIPAMESSSILFENSGENGGADTGTNNESSSSSGGPILV